MSSITKQQERVDGACYIAKKFNGGNKLDKLMKELVERKITYAEWQKERYPVKVDRTNKRRKYGVTE